jgi:hypothetical protein
VGFAVDTQPFGHGVPALKCLAPDVFIGISLSAAFADREVRKRYPHPCSFTAVAKISTRRVSFEVAFFH